MSTDPGPLSGESGRLEWLDNHCHLPDDSAETARLLGEARSAGVIGLIDVGTDEASSRAALRRAEEAAERAPSAEVPRVWSTAGLHPHDASAAGGRDSLEWVVGLLGREPVVAVGECGLDYHYDHSPRDVQRSVFAAQVAIAVEHSLPLVIHSREAWDDTFDILTAEGVPESTVFHCFTGGVAEARRALDVGAHISFSGIVSFKSAADVREAAVLCPADRMMVETDSPYLAPVPRRGRPNQPAFLPLVGAALAEARGESLVAVATRSVVNAERFYRLVR